MRKPHRQRAVANSLSFAAASAYQIYLREVRLMKLKKYICAAAAMTVFSCTAYAQQVDIYVNGNIISERGYLENDTTYVPIRAVTESMGAQVSWDGQSVHILKDEDTLVSSLISDASDSVVAIVGNYSSGSSTADKYNEMTAHGTGVVIKSNGTILTNAHVVSDITNITVVFNDGTSCGATIQCIDEDSDLATIKINKLGLKPINFGSPDDIVAGRTVIAIGTPLSLNMRNSATKGIISGKDVPVSGCMYPLIQTDAAINGGNSGGPLIDLNGNLIGINSSKYAGIGIEGVAFSIPLETINYVLDQFEKNGKVLRPEIKVSFEESWEAKIGLPTQKGLTVKNSHSAVLADGDIVTAVNGIPVHSITDYNKAIRDSFNGTLSITFTRGGAEMTADADYEMK